MTNANCNCRNFCSLFAIILSLVVGIVTAMLTFMAVITVTPAFLWVLFGIATLYLLVAPVLLSFVRSCDTRDCVCALLPNLLTGLVGTILTSLVLLAVTFAATSILGALVTGALLAFFTLVITSNACLASCTASCLDN